MVAGDHHRADAGGLASGDRRLHLGPRRVDDAGEADKGEAIFDNRCVALRAEGDAEHAHPVLGQAAVGVLDAAPVVRPVAGCGRRPTPAC
jgi:hypothetical protein